MMPSKKLTSATPFRLQGLCLLLFITTFSLSAVIFVNTGDPDHNTTPPSNPAEAKAWHLQGTWKTCQGTPIAPQWFLTAKHIGGFVGNVFTFQGKSYTAVARVLDPETDLALWGVSEPFPAFAEIYQRKDEIGKRLLIFGRGEQRGEPVLLGSEVRGWRQGQGGGFMRWGENIVDQIAGVEDTEPRKLGELIGATFDRNGLPSEAGLASCDSGGGMFLRQGNVWKLAAVNFGAGGKFKKTEDDEAFFANMLDVGGFFLQKSEDSQQEEFFEFFEDQDEDIPTNIWGTRLSYRFDWIKETIEAFPNPVQTIHLETSETINGPFSESSDWTLIQDPLAIKVFKPTAAQFYRIKASVSLNMLTPRLITNDLLIPFTGEPVANPNN